MRLPVRLQREIARMHFYDPTQSNRAIASGLQVSPNTVSALCSKLKASGLMPLVLNIAQIRCWAILEAQRQWPYWTEWGRRNAYVRFLAGGVLGAAWRGSSQNARQAWSGEDKAIPHVHLLVKSISDLDEEACAADTILTVGETCKSSM